MRNSQRVIQLAQERALFKFSALGRRMVQDATKSLETSLTTQGAGGDFRLRQAAQLFLMQHGERFLVKLDSFFRDHLDRAMRTMYTDLRRDIGSYSAESLALIDDETINRNMDVDRLVQRIRDVDSANLGRINIMIAQLHDDHEVRERENPFRPYLLARSLYDVLWAMEPEERVADVIFDYLSTAMLMQLPGYFGAIREIFESSGVQARLLARPATLSRMERLELAQRANEQRLAALRHGSGGGGSGGGGSGSGGGSGGSGSGGSGVGGSGGGGSGGGGGGSGGGSAGHGGPGNLPDSSATQSVQPANPINQDVMASLQRMLESMPRVSHDDLSTGRMPGRAKPVAAFQDFVSSIFSPVRPRSAAPNEIAVDTPSPDDPSVFALEGFPAASPLLLAKLHEYQEIAARGQAIDGVTSSDQNQLFAVREGLGAQKTTPLERVTIDIVASLFAFILEDEQIPPILRVHIGRLQIPFLKAAMLAPDLLRREDHPARQLLNRMGSLAIGVDASEPVGRALGDEIARLSGRILTEFNEDTEIFSTCLHELDDFIARQLRHADTETASSIEEIEHDEASARLLDKCNDALRLLLSPLPIDARIIDFVMLTWVRVLASTMDGNGAGSDGGSSAATLSTRQACALLPNLLWSVQDKNADERSVLLRLLPGLIKDLKSGMGMIGLPTDQSRQALDNLFDMHSRILRGTTAVDNGDRMSLEQFQQHFLLLPSQLDGMQADAGIDDTAALPAQPPGIAGEEADLRPEHESDWLAAVKVGTSIERWAEVDYKPGRLVWASMNRTLFMFKMEMDSKPVVYSAASLTKALRESSVRLIEYASVFDRAVESLLIETENIEPQPA